MARSFRRRPGRENCPGSRSSSRQFQRASGKPVGSAAQEAGIMIMQETAPGDCSKRGPATRDGREWSGRIRRKT